LKAFSHPDWLLVIAQREVLGYEKTSKDFVVGDGWCVASEKVSA